MKLLNSQEFVSLSKHEQDYLSRIALEYGGFPKLQQIWELMDEPWCDLKCDSSCVDHRISQYYTHPVWLLNGLFIEQHTQSIQNRRVFTDWVAAQSPRRVADYGGGFGGLAQMIGKACPDASVEVIEPHPHPLAINRARQTPNVSYQPKLTGRYDILIATDVFEHVPDPLKLVAETAESLKPGGGYLIANCFYPVILCHLPQTFHFRYSWDQALVAFGLKPSETVSYGRSYIRHDVLDLRAARKIEELSLKIWPLLKPLPGRLARPVAKFLIR